VIMRGSLLVLHVPLMSISLICALQRAFLSAASVRAALIAEDEVEIAAATSHRRPELM
jgi:hypothetical protein